MFFGVLSVLFCVVTGLEGETQVKDVDSEGGGTALMVFVVLFGIVERFLFCSRVLKKTHTSKGCYCRGENQGRDLDCEGD